MVPGGKEGDENPVLSSGIGPMNMISRSDIQNSRSSVYIMESSKKGELGNAVQSSKAPADDSTDEQRIVYVWDMDETLILLRTLLNGTYAEAFNGVKDVEKGIRIGKEWEKYIIDVCDDHFFYEQVEHYNEPFLQSLSEYDDGKDLSGYDFKLDGIGPLSDDNNRRKLAYRHRIIADKYKKGLKSILDEKTLAVWNKLYEETDTFTDGWLSSARNIVEECSGQGLKEPSTPPHPDSPNRRVSHVNVLVTSGALIPSFVKCLLFKLDAFFPHENLYSSWDVGKLRCFSWIKLRYGSPNTKFCVIGDGWEECEAAEILRWPFVKIEPSPTGTHRFPGLKRSTLGHYMAVIYGSSETEKDGEETKP